MFTKVKEKIAYGVLLMHPDFFMTFDIYADTSKCKLGEIVQNNLPIA